MPDETNGADGAQAAPDTQPPAGTATSQADGDDTTPESISLEEARKLRQENASLRKRLKPLEDAETTRQEAALSEQEKHDKRVAELEQAVAERERQIKDIQLRSAVTAAAARAGFGDPDDAFRLLDRDAVTFEDDGAPKNLPKLLDDMLTKKPYLASAAVRAQGSWGGGDRGAGPSSADVDMNQAIRQAAGRS